MREASCNVFDGADPLKGLLGQNLIAGIVLQLKHHFF